MLRVDKEVESECDCGRRPPPAGTLADREQDSCRGSSVVLTDRHACEALEVCGE